MLILLVILAILVIPLTAAAFMDKQFTIEEKILIHKPRNEVFAYLKLLRNAEHYNKWVMTDPNLQKEFSGTDGSAGFIYRWKSEMKQVGQGEQEIKQIMEGERIDYEIRFIKPFSGIAVSSLLTQTAGSGQTEVTWTFSGSRNYVMCLFHLLFNLSRALGKDLQTSLQNLKKQIEKS
ncbi:MAG: SRPBCC family protein [Bacteroidetes bacterium]|nr:SRPBCC family protein [Bacteroidota bacterium]